MKLYNISDVRQFLDTVIECDGTIDVVASNGTRRNMKDLAHNLLDSGMADRMGKISEVDISVDNPADGEKLLYCMAHMYKGRNIA